VLATTEDIKGKALDELHRVLESAAFRSSPRCQQFLRFVVEQRLEGRHEMLKERMIGIEVFGRDPSYQTEGDSVVRVRATDVRKRLQQYYSVATQPCVIRIDIPSGSYVPIFEVIPEIEVLPVASSSLEIEPPQVTSKSVALLSAPERTQNSQRLRWAFAGLAILIVCLSAEALRVFLPRSRPPAHRTADLVMQAFWAPAMKDPKPLLICIGSPVTYAYSKMYRAEYARQNEMSPEDNPQVAIQPTNSLNSKENVVPVIREFVGAGDANAATMLSALFGHFQKTTEFRLAGETSYAELSDSPTVLIGAFSNRWTLALTGATPFGFVEKEYVRSIEERTGRKRLWTPPNLRFDGKTDVDFAIVSRVLNAQTGHFFISAAGITSNGSRAAGYFLTHPDLLAKGLQDAPADWENKNIQFILKTQVVGGAPSVPEVVARKIW
jgi:hypothetical protein